MKTVLALAVAALFTAAARAEWKDLKPGMDQNTAIRCVGVPLMLNRGRGGAEMWTYDDRGYIEFQSGRIAYWEAPKPRKPTAAPAAVQAEAKPATQSQAARSRRAA